MIGEASNYLADQLHYAPRSISQYSRIWKMIRTYLVDHQIKNYDLSIEKQVYTHFLGAKDVSELSVNEKHFYNGLKMLTEFWQHGLINLPARPRKAPFVFEGPLGTFITDFLSYKRTETRLSKIRLDCFCRQLQPFYTYCCQHQINTIQAVNLEVLLHYLGQLDPQPMTVYQAISTLRALMRYAFAQRLLPVDYAPKLPRFQRSHQAKLPSTYSGQEVEKLIAGIDRSTRTGKRNYAIILLAARLGLRASDIINLRFEHLHWEACMIRLRQVKTGKELTLPLLCEVGQAIIDYLKYARPVCEAPQVFLTARPPYGPFPSTNIVTHVVQRAYRRAGIDVKGKRFGPRTLRHTLASRMLEKHTILPVISEVLGHQSSESTRYYLRIDLTSLRQCVLDVPPVGARFYEQKGGSFYE